MNIAEASYNGTLRTILVLLVLWWVLRAILRAQRAKVTKPPTGPARPMGDVRIERGPSQGGAGNDPGIIDAEFEEIH